MKKPHVLNRSMFKTGGTSAYGKGITSNLVSDEQRQRFNYGGRVGYQNRGYVDYTGPSYQPQGKMYPPHQRYLTTWPKSEEDFRTFKKYQFDKIPRWQDVYSDVYETEDKEDIAGLEDIGGLPYLETPKEEEKDIEFKRRMDERSAKVKEMRDVGLVVPGEGPTPAQEFGTSGVEKEIVVGEEEPSWAGIPGGGDPYTAAMITKDDTDLLDTPDKWAFLDEQQKAKQKLARGYGLTEAAAAAAKWSTAGTAKERSAAISEGLSKVGKIGAKYKGEAEDIKTKAKILGTIEDIKGEHKLDVWKAKLKDYYGKSLDIQEEEFELKKEMTRVTAERLAKGEDPKSIYASYTLPKPGDIITGQKKKDLIKRFTNRTLTVEDTKNSKDLRDPVKNKGLVFIDINGNIVRNDGTGTIKDVDEYTDEYFTWIKP